MTTVKGVTLDSALVAYAGFLREHDGVPPTTREFAACLGISTTSSSARWIGLLVEYGLLRHAVPDRKSGSSDLVLSIRGHLRLIMLGDEVKVSA